MNNHSLIRPGRMPLAILLSISLLMSTLPTLLPETATPAIAQTTSVVVSAAGINAFDLVENKLSYWGHSLCSGPLQDQAQIARRLVSIATTTQIVQPSACDVVPVTRPDVVRDDYFFYYFGGTNGTRLVRKLAVADAQTPPTVFAAADPVTSRAGLDLRDGYLYWSSYFPATDASVIYRMKADGSEPPLSMTGGAGEITWLKSLRLRNGNTVEDALVWRTDAGMYRWRAATNPPFGAVLTLANGSFYDGAHAFTGFVALGTGRSYVLAARSNALLRIDLFDGQTDVLYAAPVGRQVQAVAVDPVPPASLNNQRQIYLSEREEACVVGGGCTTTYRIKRRALDSTSWGVNEWQTIVDTLNGPGGINLRSDGLRLYYLDPETIPPTIRSIPVDAQGQLLNIAAIGLEAVQSVQSLYNDVTLIAERETLVRGYAYVTVNTTPLSDVRPSARLNAWRDGTYLGSLAPLNEPLIDTVADLAVLRADPDRSYLFSLPLNWVSVGVTGLSKLRLELEVNHDGLIAESGLNTGNDNRFPISPNDSSTILDIVQPDTPCLVLIRVSATGAPTPKIFPHNIPNILDRARSYLPVSNLKVFTSPITLSDSGDPFHLNEDDGYILNLLEWIWLGSDHPDGCTETFYAGMISPYANWEWGGIARMHGNVLLFKTSSDANSLWNKPGGGTILAHELGHNYGRKHVECAHDPEDWKGQDDFETEYPYPICQISHSNTSARGTHFGFDKISLDKAYFPEDRFLAVIAPAAASDLMGYKRPRWVSP
ncbi:MAG TPA: hypothetical protein PKC19_22320, partial [Roseiflexaceae bacterium]|nr:hypothetical protein [Roseiflexaceae bacterium]